MKIIQWLQLLASIVFCLFVGGLLGSLFTTPSIPTWYATLIKPPIQPPNWLFGPVWTILYIMMGIAAFMVWDSKGNKDIKRTALILFGIQLALNVLWSPIFFTLHWLFAAFVVIVFLWTFILLTMIQFNKISRPAAVLLAPYLLWVSFASVLNLWIWLLNR